MSQMLPVTVAKIGGSLLDDVHTQGTFWDGISRLRSSSSVVIVHGGGPQATEMARRIGHEPRIVQGRRVTTELDLDVIHWTVRGSLNTRLVAAAIRHSVPAVGVSGVDGALLRVRKRPPWKLEDQTVDFGWVGDVKEVDASLLRVLLEAGFTPVVAPLGVDDTGQTYNVNADTVACSIAVALSATRFLLVTETGGVLRDPADPHSRLAKFSDDAFEAGRAEGWIRDGMLVKLKVAFDALSAGVPEVHILAPDDLAARTRGTQVVP